MASSPSHFPRNYTFTFPHSSLSRRSKPTVLSQRLPIPNDRRSTRTLPLNQRFAAPKVPTRGRKLTCKVVEVSVTEESSALGGGDGVGENWVPVVPLTALPKGERRVIIQDGETILLLWYKEEIFAIENRSPAEGAYSEGLLNAKLTKDLGMVPKIPVLKVLTPALRTMYVYPVKTDEENIYINMRGSAKSEASAEIVFSGKAQPGVTASDVNVEEVRMVVDEDSEGFGFTRTNELINGKAAVIGFLLLLDCKLLTGKGLLKGTGFLDFIYKVSNALK